MKTHKIAVEGAEVVARMTPPRVQIGHESNAGQRAPAIQEDVLDSRVSLATVTPIKVRMFSGYA